MSEDQRRPGRRVHSAPPGSYPTSPDYEYRTLRIPPGTSRSDARRLLTDHAEYGRWELARVQLSFGGGRRIWLRRRIIRVERTLSPG